MFRGISHILFASTLVLGTPSLLLACKSLGTLAALDGGVTHTQFATVYGRAIAEIEETQPLTTPEREALLKNPFVLPDFESGRTEVRRLLAHFEKAFDELPERERETLLASLREHLLPKNERRAQEESRVRETVSKRHSTGPEAELILHSLAHTASRDPDPLFQVFPDGKRILLMNGTLALEMNEPGSNLPPHIIERRNYRYTQLDPGGEWAIAWPFRGDEINEPTPLWVPADPKRSPTTTVPIPALGKVDIGAGYDRIKKVTLAENGTRYVVETNMNKTMIFSSVDSSVPAGKLTKNSMFHLTADGKLFVQSIQPLPSSGLHQLQLVAPNEAPINIPIGLHSTSPIFGPGPVLGKEHVLATIRYPKHAKPDRVFLFEIDTNTGRTKALTEYPNLKVYGGNLLARQPVWMNVLLTNDGFKIHLVSKTQPGTVARAEWKGVVYKIASSPDGSKIVVSYKRPDHAYAFETYDVADWLRNGIAEPPRGNQ